MEFNRGKIKAAAIDLTLDKSTHLPSRITAVNACAELRASEIVPEVRKIFNTIENDTAQRISAIETIGELGNAEDLKNLQQILQNSNPIYHRPLRKAMKKTSSKKSKRQI